MQRLQGGKVSGTTISIIINSLSSFRQLLNV